MKKYFLLTIIALLALNVYSQPISVTVDERAELMGVVLRLSEAKEFLYDGVVTDVTDKYFGKHKNHSLIDYTIKLRNDNGLDSKMFMEMVFCLNITNGQVKLRKDIDINRLGNSWNKDRIVRYVELLNKFYTETDFASFFTSIVDKRTIAEKNFVKEVIDKIDFKWFDKFFGFSSSNKLHVIISPTIGRNKYSFQIPDKNGLNEFYAIIGDMNKDKNGYPVYKDDIGSIRDIVVRNVCNSLCDRLIVKYQKELLPKATEFNSLIKNNHRKPYNNPMSFFREIFSRACNIQYRLDMEYDRSNKEEFIVGKKYEIAKEVDNGFLYIPELLNALSTYNANRSKYKTFESFMPEIVKIQNSLNPLAKYNEINEQKPVILGTNIDNNSVNVNYNLNSITLYFDRPMSVKANGTMRGSHTNIEITDSKWSKDGKEWTIYVKLNPDTKYQIVYPKMFFKGAETYLQPKDTYTLTFTTKKAN